MLQIENLQVAFRGHNGDTDVVRGLDLQIEAGETHALVGESGSGKSITARAVLQLLPESARVSASALQFEGESLIDASPNRLRQLRGGGIGMVFQEPMTALNPLHTVAKQIGETLLLHQGLSTRKTRERTLQLLERVGIDDAQSRLGAYPHELSGGQRQRVMIAMALANDPRLLIADEPTTALDVTVEAQILSLLASLQQETGMAMLLISHDLGVVRKVASHTSVMRNGEIVEAGTTDGLFARPQHAYTQHLIGAEPTGSPGPVATDAPTVLRGEGMRVVFPLTRSFFGRVKTSLTAVDDVSLDVSEGETLGIVGESGSGKSTLAQSLLRLLPNDAGRIEFESQALEGLTQAVLRPIRQRLQIVFQDPFGSLSPRLSVAQLIGEGLAVHEPDLNATEREVRVVRALEEVELDPDSRHRYPHEFSGGQRQRIAIARALVLQPRLVVLDEPTSALDRSVQAQVLELLKTLQTRHKLAYLFISHDLKVVRAISHRVMVMRQGQVVEQGDTEQIFNHPAHPYTKALLAAATNRDLDGTDVAL